MKLERSQVLLKDIRIYGFHGVLPQERAVGAYFIINVEVDADIYGAMSTDSLDDTISYAGLYELIKREMAVPSKLLEHVAGRICEAIFASFPAAKAVNLEIIKENPPMGADLRGAGVKVSVTR